MLQGSEITPRMPLAALANYNKPKAAQILQMPQRNHQRRNLVVSRDEMNLAYRIEEAAQTLLQDCAVMYERGNSALARREFDSGMFLLNDAMRMRQEFLNRVAGAPGVTLAC